jgi:hypothetical protein
MHPESLRMPSREPYFDRVISTHLKGGSDSVGGDMKLLRVVGADAFRNRLLTRALPIPLTGEYAEHYGFNLNLWEYLDQNNGSALDPHTYPATTPSGNPEYRLAPQLEAAAKLVAADLHLSRTRLVVGITPSPDDYVFRNHAETCRAMLATWAQSLNADASLNALPFILPRTHFASTTHLNQRGVTEYTALLAKALATP